MQSPVSPKMIRFLAFLCACFCCSQTLLAWNAEGHMVVAQIAYNHLDAAVKAKCDALIAAPLAYGGDSTTNFVTAACWADDYKSKLNTGTWHYIDLPFSLDGTSTNGFVPASFDIVQAINLAITTLQSSSTSQSNRAASLRYLLHFVGDSYLDTVQTTTEQRMALGGHRLADLLTTLFASNPIRLGAVSRTNGNFGFSWDAVSGQTYHVQWKEQLGDLSWNDLTNITAAGDSASFSEPLGQTWRFYRVGE